MNQSWAAIQSEALFQSLTETTSAALWIIQEGSILYANPAAQSMAGYSAQQLAGMPFASLLHPASARLLPGDPKQEQPAAFELTLVTPTGERRVDAAIRWVEMDGRPALLLTAFDITALHRQNQQVRHAAEQMNAVFHTVAEAIVVYSPQGEVLQANARAEAIYGVKAQGLSLKDVQNLLVLRDPDGRLIPPHEWPSSRALRGETIAEQPFTLTNTAGEVFHVMVSCVPLFIEGQFAGAVASYRDVSEQQRLLSENVRRAEELSAIVVSMAEVIILFDRSGTIILSNPAASKVFDIDPTGLTCEQLVEKTQLTYADGSIIPLSELPSTRALGGEQIIEERYSMRRAGRSRNELLISVSPIRLESGISGAVAVCHDITIREQLLAELRSERARLSAIIEHAPEAILVSDAAGRIVLANHSAGALLNQSDMFNKTPTELDLRLIDAEGQQLSEDRLPAVRSAKYGETITDLEVRIVLPDGSQRELLINSSPIVEPDGSISGAVTLAQDISTRKRNERRAHEAAARAELLAALSQSFAEAGLYHAAVLTSISIQISERIRDTSIIRMLSDDGRWLDVVAVHHPEPASLSQLRKVIRANRVRLDQSLEGEAFRGKKAVLIRDISSFPDQSLLEKQYGSWLSENNARSILVAPLLAQDNVLGTLTMIRSNRDAYGEEDQHFFTNLADRAALAIENSRLFAQEQNRARQMDALHTATATLLKTLDLDELLAQILNSAQSAIPSADHSALHLIEPQTGQLEVRATLSLTDLRIAQLSNHHGLDYPGFVVKNREPLLINDTLTTAEQGSKTADRRNSVRSLIIAPLIIRDEVIGTLSLTAARSHAFTREDLQLLISFATTTSAAIHNARLHSQVQTLALTDPLTELYNRRGFFELAQREMDRYLRYQYPLTAIMLDIDHFKVVNDTYGHPVGDRVLRALAERIYQNIRHVDILGRYGGEEFILLLPDTELAMACEIGERIRQAVEVRPMVETEQGPVTVTISLGLSRARAGVRTLAELLELADQALYQAKQNGRNRLEIN